MTSQTAAGSPAAAIDHRDRAGRRGMSLLIAVTVLVAGHSTAAPAQAANDPGACLTQNAQVSLALMKKPVVTSTNENGVNLVRNVVAMNGLPLSECYWGAAKSGQTHPLTAIIGAGIEKVHPDGFHSSIEIGFGKAYPGAPLSLWWTDDTRGTWCSTCMEPGLYQGDRTWESLSIRSDRRYRFTIENQASSTLGRAWYLEVYDMTLASVIFRKFVPSTWGYECGGGFCSKAHSGTAAYFGFQTSDRNSNMGGKYGTTKMAAGPMTYRTTAATTILNACALNIEKTGWDARGGFPYPMTVPSYYGTLRSSSSSTCLYNQMTAWTNSH